MTRFKLIACGVASALFLHGCSQILEPVSFFGSATNGNLVGQQEEFEINIESLTFDSAQKANNAAYPRRLMLSGSRAKANVFDEADFLTSNMPEKSEIPLYTLGIGDELSFTQLHEFLRPIIRIPAKQLQTDYLVGVGDELTLVQLNRVRGTTIPSISNDDDDKNNKTVTKPQTTESVLKTSGIVGTDGNILLLGVGRIKAADRSLNDIQTEVRNILIRNGLAPSFQLEITLFKGRKAFVTFPSVPNATGNDLRNNVVPITNLPVTLKEVVISYGVRPSAKDTVRITLRRNGTVLRMTAAQMFAGASQKIIIQDKDQIEIDMAETDSGASVVRVGAAGNILLPGIGSLKVENRLLNELRTEIASTLIRQGLSPKFQLELTGFHSKKFHLIAKKYGSKVVPLTSDKTDLRHAILDNDIATVAHEENILSIIELIRNGQKYQIPLAEIMSNHALKIWIQDGDQIELKDFNYKLGQVFALGGAGNAKIVTIDPSKRETLADILFVSGGALSNVLAKRSEVYLLRGRSPSVAYHLDAQNVSRILVAAQTELRPNDIVYVADRPIISFSRTLAELNPLRILLRDLENGNIP